VHGAPGPRTARWQAPLALLAIVGFGAWTRASGFSSSSLWFDDAWSAMPARVGLSTAVRMITTAPGYTLGMRAWLRLHPQATWWAQLPAFVVGLVGIVAVFFVLRYFSSWWPLPYVGALVVAASPVAVAYATRVKQFGVDLVLACLVLWLFERWRRSARLRDASLLAAGCASSLLVSTTTLLVCVPAAAVAVLSALTAADRRRGALLVAGVTGATLVASDVLWLRHLSPSLHFGWTKHGYLLSTSSLHRIAFSLEAMGTGIFHWMLGTPLGRTRLSTAITPLGVVLALVAAAVLAVIVAPPLVAFGRRRSPGPLVVPALAVMLAIVLALLAKSPFGGGRTDEVLYPAILVLAAGAITAAAERFDERARRLALAGVVVVVAVLVGVGATHRAAYPTSALRTLDAELRPHVRPGDVVVVDPWVTFTWAYDDLSPTAVSFAPTAFSWSQGFHIVSRTPSVDISTNYFLPDASYVTLSARTHRLWFVASTHSSGLPGRPLHMETTFNFTDLLHLGWVRGGTEVVAPHAVAVLLVWRPVSSPGP